MIVLAAIAGNAMPNASAAREAPGNACICETPGPWNARNFFEGAAPTLGLELRIVPVRACADFACMMSHTDRPHSASNRSPKGRDRARPGSPREARQRSAAVGANRLANAGVGAVASDPILPVLARVPIHAHLNCALALKVTAIPIVLITRPPNADQNLVQRNARCHQCAPPSSDRGPICLPLRLNLRNRLAMSDPAPIAGGSQRLHRI